MLKVEAIDQKSMMYGLRVYVKIRFSCNQRTMIVLQFIGVCNH